MLSSEELFQKLVGQWEGSCRTWFEPDKLADESKITSKLSILLGKNFLRHSSS